jgi:drug/metabolite transporter (DMT)-like permease
MQTKSFSTRHVLAYLALCAIWGSTWLAIRVVVRDLPPFLSAALRFVLASGLLLIFAASRRLRFPQDLAQWRTVVILGITMMAIPYGFIFWAEQRITSGMSAVLFSASPLIIALFTPWVIKQTVPRSAVYAMLIGLGGIALLFQTQLRDSPRALLGGGAVLLAVLSSSWSSLYAKRWAVEIDPFVSTAIQLLVGSFFLFCISVAVERSAPVHWTPLAIAGLLYLATFGSAVAFVVYYWLLRHMRPYQLSTLNLVVPIVAVTIGAILLQEPVPLMMVLSAALVLFSVAVVLRSERDVLLRITPAEAGTEAR